MSSTHRNYEEFLKFRRQMGLNWRNSPGQNTHKSELLWTVTVARMLGQEGATRSSRCPNRRWSRCSSDPQVGPPSLPPPTSPCQTVGKSKEEEFLGMHKARKMKVAQSCPTLCDPTDSTVHGIL